MVADGEEIPKEHKFAWVPKKAKAETLQRELTEPRQDIMLHLVLVNMRGLPQFCALRHSRAVS